MSDVGDVSGLRAQLEEDPMRVAIVGGGVGGLVAARELARPGFEVVVLEASERLGGSVAPLEIGGIAVDAGAESYATRGGAVEELIRDLGLSDDIVRPNPAGAWLQLADRAVHAPAGGLLGIPSSPLAEDVVAAIGWRAALRAYLDRLLPPLKIGQERNLARLVRRRMGRAVLEQLVAPVTSGVYSAPPELIDVDAAAPGLNQALTSMGTLSGAVASLRGEASRPGSAVGGIRGGMFRLVEALAADAAARGAELRTGARVVVATPVDEGYALTLESGEDVEADAVLLDVPSVSALPLLAGLSPELADAAAQDWPDATDVELVTLAIDEPALDAFPRGTGVLVAKESPVAAKAMTHLTAKWEWCRDALPTGRHLVRLSYGRAGAADATATLSDAELRAQAVADASALFGIPISESTVIDMARVAWQNAQPLAAEGQRERLSVLNAALSGTDAVEATGSWLAGTGLASVVPHARDAAARLRGLRWKSLTSG